MSPRASTLRILLCLLVGIFAVLQNGCSSNTAADTTAIVVGHVFDNSGSPIANAIISSEPGAKSTSTDANGYYILRGFNAGTYSISATGTLLTPQTLSVTLAANEVRVLDYMFRTKVDSTGSIIVGRITDAIGKPIFGATVFTEPNSGFATSDSTGFYSIFGVPAGSYKVLSASNTSGVGSNNVETTSGSFATCNISLSAPDDSYKALRFQATKPSAGYVKVPNSEELNLCKGSFTIECWYNVSSLLPNTFGSWILNKGNSNNENEYMLGFAQPGALTFWSSYTGTVISASPGTLGQWNHVAVVVDAVNSTVTIYLNGVVSATAHAALTNHIQTNSPFFIGARNNLGSGNGAELLDGMVDEVRLWNIARPLSEIRTSRFKALKGTESGLVAYWNCNEQSGTTLTDNSGNSHNGQLVDIVERVEKGPPVFAK